MDTTLSVAVLGSSGGGTATLGHTDAPTLLRTIQGQLGQIGCRVATALYVSLDGGKPLDGANDEEDLATLYQVDNGRESEASSSSNNPSQSWNCQIVQTGTLRQVNAYCCKLDERIAFDIEQGRIRGLICISCHTGIFQKTLMAASTKKIPVTGSGGTSLSQIATLYNIQLVGNTGGSVAMTTFTRAVAYTNAFAVYYKRPYRPWERKGQPQLAWRSTLNACLPAFWGVCLTKKALQMAANRLRITGEVVIPNSDLLLGPVLLGLENFALPCACSVIVATATHRASSSSSSSSLQPPHDIELETPMSTLIMASIIAATSCGQSIVAGLVAGYLVSSWSSRLVYSCLFHDVPVTMTSMLTAGGVGGVVALLLAPIAPMLRGATSHVRGLLVASVTSTLLPPTVRGFLGVAWGLLSCYGSKVGWYHAFFLPLILIEMELGDASFLGAVDELSLVLVCAGVCAGNLVAVTMDSWSSGATISSISATLSESEVSLCRRGLLVNIFCGDFVEACYPFMERHPFINLGGYLASGLSCGWLVIGASATGSIPKSLAYLPVPVSVVLAGSAWYPMMTASFIAFGASFVVTLLQHMTVSRSKRD